MLPRGRKFIPDPLLESGWKKFFINSRGKDICTLLLEAPSQPKGVVILAHPYLAEARNFFLGRGHADMYRSLGYHVITFDFNGFGESPFHDFAYASDLEAVADEARRRYGNLLICGHGVSFGASHTITYATRESNHFDCIIIENCLDSNLSYYKKRNRKLHYLVKALMKIFPGSNSDHNYVRSISRLHNVNRVLLIYNSDDELTTPIMGRQLEEACNKPVTFCLMNGKHLNALKDNQALYSKTISVFLSDGFTA